VIVRPSTAGWDGAPAGMPRRFIDAEVRVGGLRITGGDALVIRQDAPASRWRAFSARVGSALRWLGRLALRTMGKPR